MGPGPKWSAARIFTLASRPQSFASRCCPYTYQSASVQQMPIVQITAEVSMSSSRPAARRGRYDISTIGGALRLLGMAIPGERRPSGRLHLPACALAEV